MLRSRVERWVNRSAAILLVAFAFMIGTAIPTNADLTAFVAAFGVTVVLIGGALFLWAHS